MVFVRRAMSLGLKPPSAGKRGPSAMLRLWNIWSLWGGRADFEVPVWASGPDEAVQTAHRQGVGWGYGNHPTFEGFHAQRALTCEGCDGVTAPPVPGSYDASIVIPTQSYIVTLSDGTFERVRYCEECAELARADWNGETRAITPVGAHDGLFVECTEERYNEMLGVLPPVAWVSKGFLMGEPLSHRTCERTGRCALTYRAMVRHGDHYYQSTRGITVAEWRALDCSHMP